ncbi:MAG: Gfo/Idh/MocA family oxidoreductase [Candidatus Hydrogenedentota bacterium]
MSTPSNRRDFLKTAALGAATVSLTARNHARAQGANDRLRIGLIGCGSRGIGAHMTGVHNHDKKMNCEIVAFADPWKKQREKAANLAKEWYGGEPMQFVSYRDLLEKADVDAVLIASCDHQHTTHLEAAAKAGKDVYVEKPLGMDLERVKRAVDAVNDAGIVCQVGTQLRSYPSFNGCKKVYESGVLGKVARIEQRRNGSQPYWYGRLADLKEEDVDWQEFLMHLEDRPFDQDLYSGWYGYRAFSDGPVPGLGSHFIDLVHHITGATFPTSCQCMGGVYTWKDEHNFTAPDNVQAEWQYPEGFLVTYATNFGNGSGNSFRIYGEQGAIDMVNWNDPYLTNEGVHKSKETGAVPDKEEVEHVSMPDHMLDWLQCIHDRKQPNAPMQAGYQHAVAVIMAMQAFDAGKTLYYDAESRTIKDA